MAHVYSLVAMLGYKDSIALAEAAVNGLCGELHDTVSGGWYAGIKTDGSVISVKQCYAHAFVILGASSAVKAGIKGAEDLLTDALDIYEKYFLDSKNGMAFDSWDASFDLADDYRGLNAIMHSTEAFLAASDVTGDDKYRKRAGVIIDRVIGFAESNRWRIPEHYTRDWIPDTEYNKEKPYDQFKPYGATPGHAIEWARLIVQWAYASYGDDKLAMQSYIDAALDLYGTAVNDGWDADGAPGFCYTTDWNGKAVVHDRMHWTLAEAINTSAVLYRATGDRRYSSDYAMYMDYLDSCVIDHISGSWFHQLDRNNRVTDTVWPGKPDLYHAVQATLIPYNYDPGVSISSAKL
jgi:mannose/cellobiose epimerase-like protein (N-acyl-D-glucosamine 2-epimerase family)